MGAPITLVIISLFSLFGFIPGYPLRWTCFVTGLEQFRVGAMLEHAP